MILGIDPGERRIGVAVADSETRFARPLEVIDTTRRDPIERIGELVRELQADVVVVGRPVSLSGREGPAVRNQQRLVARLKNAVSARITEFDERFTTVTADQGLQAAGGRAPARKARRDAVAAQVMLQSYLDSTG